MTRNERMGSEIIEAAQVVGTALAGEGKHIGHLPDMCRDLAKERDAALRRVGDLEDVIAQHAYIVFANLHPRLRDGYSHDWDVDIPAMRAAIESIWPLGDVWKELAAARTEIERLGKVVEVWMDRAYDAETTLEPPK
jgi:methyl coenzyme M reductase subunit C-like uncharacterized protein (methanogenesis marker protein 7)